MRRWRRTITGEMEMVRTDQDGEKSDSPLPPQSPNYEPSSSKSLRRWRRTITGEMELVRTGQDGEESDFPLPLQNPNCEPSSSKRRRSVGRLSGNSSGDEEGEEAPNRLLHGSLNSGGSPLNSSEPAMEEESDSLGRRNRPSGGEDDDSDGFQFPRRNPNFSPSPIHSGEEDMSSLDRYIGLDGEEYEEISNLIRYRRRYLEIHSPAREREGEERGILRNRRNWEEDEDKDEDCCPSCRSRSRKRRNRGESPGEDRISLLPDGVLLHIISFLPADSGIRTGALSKRWMNLWKNSTNFVLHFRGMDNKFHDFCDSVNRTLDMYSSSKIKKFHLHSFHSPFHCLLQTSYSIERSHDVVESWLCFAIGREVEEISLKFGCCESNDFRPQSYDSYSSDDYEMSQYLFNCSSLTKLSSFNCTYGPEDEVYWGSLGKLTIGTSELSNDVFQKILIGSPKLKWLKLKEVLVDRIDLSSNSELERLVIQDRRPWKKFEISATNVKSLEILGNWKGSSFQLSNASSLVNARVEFLSFGVDHEEDANDEADFVDMVSQLLQEINHAEQLTLGCMCVQVLSILAKRGLPYPLVNCNIKCLTLNMKGIHDFELPGIAGLLYNSPNLEKLVINFDTQAFEGILPSFKNHCKLGGDDFWKSQERSFNCLVRHLKTIEFSGFEGCSCDGPADTIVEYLLRNSSVLEKLVLYPDHSLYASSQMSWYRWARKLLSIQKASPHALVFLPGSFEDT